MNDLLNDHISKLKNSIYDKLANNASGVLEEANKSTVPLLLWIDYLIKSEATGNGDELLLGLRASAIEIAACLAIGFVRPAIFSMRAEIDISLSWLYFKDHPVEWSKVVKTGDGFKLKREVVEYLDDHFDGYSARLALISKDPSRKNYDPYKLLSAFVHSQSPASLPKYLEINSVVWSGSKVDEAVKLQGLVVGYLCDVFLSVYYTKWNSLPVGIQSLYNVSDHGGIAKALSYK